MAVIFEDTVNAVPWTSCYDCRESAIRKLQLVLATYTTLFSSSISLLPQSNTDCLLLPNSPFLGLGNFQYQTEMDFKKSSMCVLKNWKRAGWGKGHFTKHFFLSVEEQLWRKILLLGKNVGLKYEEERFFFLCQFIFYHVWKNLYSLYLSFGSFTSI